MGRVRVLCLIKGLGVGGAERLLVSAAKARDAAGFDYEVVYLLPWKDAFVHDLEAEKVPVTCLDANREWNLAWALRLRRRLVTQPVDVVHAHSPYVAGFARLVALTLPRRCRPRIVTTEHIAWQAHNRITRLLNLLTFPLDSAHFAVSAEVTRSLPAWHRRRVETLVHGVVLATVRQERALRGAMRAELGVGPEVVLVGTVANFRFQKAYPVLLRAAARVAEAGLAVRFVCVGQGPEEAEVRRLHAELGLGDTVRLLGGRTDATQVMAACDIFVLASHYEGYPVAIMEALALGLPVVATRVGGVPDAVEDGVEGLLVPPDRPELIADALLALAADPDRRHAMGARAYERGGDYDISRAVGRMEETYRSLAAGGPVERSPSPSRVRRTP